ncbi:signal recognition particle receptor subunit alpha [Candidatus Palauibacter sp.]|uniref:signal recognition particle receptor subunit alpha n=1 Tax=Candidatus Palauibacter sp. TaxID=3101350 RepID=UPI003B51CEBF
MTGTLRRPKRGLWRRIVDFALTDVNTLVHGGLDGAAIERLEEVLLEADFGVDITLELVEALERAASRGAIATEDDLRATLRAQLAEALATAEPPAAQPAGGSPADPPPRGAGPGVLLLVGVNGVGKTTTAAKLAARLQAGGGRVLLAAADTFRAGAQEQLRAWAERLQTDFVGGTPGADPASVAFDALVAARARMPPGCWSTRPAGFIRRTT